MGRWTNETIEARECAQVIGWSQRQLADVIGVHETRVRRILAGSLPMPANLLAWLRALRDFHQQNPPPRLIGPGG